jgi:uncharacterized membrane protein
MERQVFFDAIVQPNRPLSPKGLTLVIGFVAAISFAAGIMFVLRGAWPVTPFFGADVLLLALAFRASVRASRKHEHLMLTRDALTIERVSARGEIAREEINPYWLRVDHDDPELLGADLALVSGRQRWIVGSFLGAEERVSLAEALRHALRAARSYTPS